jgi:hypothetical protein
MRESVETFRRNLRAPGGLRRWLDLNAGPEELRALMDWLGYVDQALSKEIDALERMEVPNVPYPAEPSSVLCAGL